jgi:hypothetical protein
VLQLERPGGWSDLVCPSRGWAHWLGAAGIATSVHTRPAGGRPRRAWGARLPDDQIRQWLTRGLLLDGTAARILEERGFGSLTGLTDLRVITQDQVVYATETCTHPDFTRRVGAQLSVNSEFFTAFGQQLIQGLPAPAAQEITELRGPAQERVGHGILRFTNELGGRVVITPWNADTKPVLNALRAEQLARLLRWLDPGGACGRVEGGAWLVPLVLRDEQAWRAVIWNAGGMRCASWRGMRRAACEQLGRGVAARCHRHPHARAGHAAQAGSPCRNRSTRGNVSS